MRGDKQAWRRLHRKYKGSGRRTAVHGGDGSILGWKFRDHSQGRSSGQETD